MNWPSLPYRWMLGSAVAAWGLVAWTVFLNVPPPNPWMMGDEAFRRITTVYAVAIGGSIVASVLAVAVGARLRSLGLLVAAIPAATYLLVVLIRVTCGLPISLGELTREPPASFEIQPLREHEHTPVPESELVAWASRPSTPGFSGEAAATGPCADAHG